METKIEVINLYMQSGHLNYLSPEVDPDSFNKATVYEVKCKREMVKWGDKWMSSYGPPVKTGKSWKFQAGQWIAK